MNPLIVIPSYWDEKSSFDSASQRSTYDYTTAIDKPLPELETCLDSLEQVRGVLRVAVLVVAPSRCAASARARVESICKTHKSLNILIIGQAEASYITSAIARVAPKLDGEAISLRGYGAIKNLGLCVASIFGHDVCIFMEDDEVAVDENFLLNACFGLGSATKQGLPILAKTGCVLNRNNSPYKSEDQLPFRERRWSRAKYIDELVEAALAGPRLSRSQLLFSGAIALHARAYTSVPFDPFITRGEDLDYLFNLRGCGLDVWFDNEWVLRSQPPIFTNETNVFLQDVHRWYYDSYKLESFNARPNMRAVTAASLVPYPGTWLNKELPRRITSTVLRRMLTGPDRSEYFGMLVRGIPEAKRWAEEASSYYLAFLAQWPRLISCMWDEEHLQAALLKRAAR